MKYYKYHNIRISDGTQIVQYVEMTNKNHITVKVLSESSDKNTWFKKGLIFSTNKENLFPLTDPNDLIKDIL